MFCCVCAGQCNHVGSHTYCPDHGGARIVAVGIVPSITPPSPPLTPGCPHGHVSWQQCPRCLLIRSWDVPLVVEAQDPVTGAWGPAEPMGWQDETEDTPAWLRRLQRAIIAAIDGWRGERRDWRAGASW